MLSNQVYLEAYSCTSLKAHPDQKHFLAQSNGNYIAIFSTQKPYKMNKKKALLTMAISDIFRDMVDTKCRDIMYNATLVLMEVLLFQVPQMGQYDSMTTSWGAR